MSKIFGLLDIIRRETRKAYGDKGAFVDTFKWLVNIYDDGGFYQGTVMNSSPFTSASAATKDAHRLCKKLGIPIKKNRCSR